MNAWLLGVAFVLVGLSLTVHAQFSKPARIGFLWTSSSASVSSYRDAFAGGLRQLGYVEGRDVTIEHRYGEDRLETLPDLAHETVRVGADVIGAQGTPAVRAAKAPPRRSRSSWSTWATRSAAALSRVSPDPAAT
jgi:putative tryptophan/tyrosine transport system substrate-binding protein